MKTLQALLIALLLSTPMFAARINAKAEPRDLDVAIDTSSVGITVMEQYYQDTQSVPGSYTIDGKKGTVPFVNLKAGFRIDDPALAQAIDGHKAKVVLTFESEPENARYPILVTVTLP